MTGPEHYAAAEELIATVDDGNAPDTQLTEAQLLAMAQVHATLALAAATALSDTTRRTPAADYKAWRGVASERPGDVQAYRPAHVPAPVK